MGELPVSKMPNSVGDVLICNVKLFYSVFLVVLKTQTAENLALDGKPLTNEFWPGEALAGCNLQFITRCHWIPLNLTDFTFTACIWFSIKLTQISFKGCWSCQLCTVGNSLFTWHNHNHITSAYQQQNHLAAVYSSYCFPMERVATLMVKGPAFV